MKKTKIGKDDYVDNDSFYKLIKQYKVKKDRKTLNSLGKDFLKIAQHIIKLPNFINYSYDRKCEMISDATFFMVKYIDTYDVKRNNPFAFFSQIAFNAFKQNINKYNKFDNIFIPLNYVENMSRKSNSNLTEE